MRSDIEGLGKRLDKVESALKRVAAEVVRNSAKADDIQGIALSTKSSVDRLVARLSKLESRNE